MQTYYINEGRMLIPDGWQDQSVTVFASPATPPHEFSFVISRQPVVAGMTLTAYVDGQLEELSRTLTEFKRIRRHDTRLDNLPAIAAEFTWKSEYGRMHQHQTYVIIQQTALTFTATSRDDVYMKYESEIQRLLLTFKFGQ